MAESLISLTHFPSGPFAVFGIEWLNYSLYPKKLDVSQISINLAKLCLLWLQHWDGFCNIQWSFFLWVVFKGTLMQIWKSPCMFLFIYKYYPENFAFLTLRILELYTRKVCVIFVYKRTETIEYVKKYANF